MTNEEHLQDFYNFLLQNDKRLRKNLKKNITYNAEYFDDAYDEAIMRVANAILRGRRIDDFEQYFFIASKFAYIKYDLKAKNDLKAYIPIGEYDVEDEEYSEERDMKINKLIDFTQNVLERYFEGAEVDIFLIYYKLKCNKRGISYKKLADITSIPLQQITQIIKKLKLFIKSNTEINEYKKKILNDD